MVLLLLLRRRRVCISVCLSVCLSVLSYISNLCPDFTKFSVDITSVLLRRQCNIRYVLPVLWMTSWSQIQIQSRSPRRSELFTAIRQVAPLNCEPKGRSLLPPIAWLFLPYLFISHRAYFSVYYYTKCVLLKAGCATLKRKVCNIKFLR